MSTITLVLGYALHGNVMGWEEVITSLLPACTLLAMGAAGVPMGALAMMAGVLPLAGVESNQVGSIMALLIAFDPFLARGRTLINLFGDAVAPLVLYKRFLR